MKKTIFLLFLIIFLVGCGTNDQTQTIEDQKNKLEELSEKIKQIEGEAVVTEKREEPIPSAPSPSKPVSAKPAPTPTKPTPAPTTPTPAPVSAPDPDAELRQLEIKCATQKEAEYNKLIGENDAAWAIIEAGYPKLEYKLYTDCLNRLNSEWDFSYGGLTYELNSIAMICDMESKQNAEEAISTLRTQKAQEYYDIKQASEAQYLDCLNNK